MSEHREFCHNCGVQIAEPSAFCSNCGAALERSDGATDTRGSSRASTARATSATATDPTTNRGAATNITDPPIAGSRSDMATSTPTHPASGSAEAPPPGTTASPPATPTGEQADSRSRRWLPFALVGGAAFVVLAAVVGLLLAVGGSAGKNVKSAAVTRQQALALLAANGTTTVSQAAPGLFALVTAEKLSLAVPAGWRATAQSVGPTTRAEFADPSHAGSSLTVVAETVRGGSAHTRAVTARKAVASKGNSTSSLASIVFPGGRQAWRLSYSAANVTHNTYFSTACNGAVAMVVDAAARPALIRQQQAAMQAAAASAEPQC